jgi:hypothetical protein
MKRYRTLAALIAAAAPVVLLGVATRAQLPAFPGAEGFGADAVAGRGADAEVFHVTSLADTNTGTYSAAGFKGGTLRYALQHASTRPRTIVFDVGGTIKLGSNLDIKNLSGIRIAGQTAPGEGITLTGHTLQVTSSSSRTTSNIVLQHVRSRKGNITTAEDAVGVLGSGSTHTVVLDHVSASWGEDEVLSLTNNSNNVTVQHSFINEGLNAEGHGYASLIRPQISANYSYHHNLVAHHKSRMPRPGSYNGSTTNLDFRNNVLYNWLEGPGYSEDNAPGEFVNMNYVGNYGIAGPNTPSSRANRLFDGGGTNTSIHQSGNWLDSDKDSARDGAPVGSSAFIGVYTSMVTPFGFAPVTTQSADVAYEMILLRGGAMPWARDPTDTRIVNEVRTQAGTVQNVQPAAEWSAIDSAPAYLRPADWDTDFDGMPNWWELGRGSNPAVADQNVITASGYSLLENYINTISNTSAWGDAPTGDWSSHANWLGGAPNAADTVASFASLAAGPVTSKTITADAPVTVGMIHFDSPFIEYTIGGGSNPITLDDATSGIAAINLLAGAQHTIAAPLNLADDTAIVVMPAGGALVMSGPVNATGRTIAKLGPGTARLGHVRAGALAVNGGVAQLLPGTSPPHAVNAISVSFGSTLDVTDNSIVIDYTGPSPLAELTARIASGYAGGSWTGTGMTSSTAADDASGAVKTAVGIAEALALGINNYFGEPVDDDTVIIAHALYGDANLDRTVNLADFNRLASNFGTSGATWARGDFNYDGLVNLIDFNLMAANFGIAARGGEVTPEDWAALASAVPEPGAGTMLILLLPLLRRWHGRPAHAR